MIRSIPINGTTLLPEADHYGINAPGAWDITTGSASIVVAVIDTGITSHPDLNGRTVAGYDFISDVLDRQRRGCPRQRSQRSGRLDRLAKAVGYSAAHLTNSSWHGTHTAGTIGAAGNNGAGVAGINWNSKILPVRVLGKCGGYTLGYRGWDALVGRLVVSGVPDNANPAKVINMSLGGSGSCSATYQNAINADYRRRHDGGCRGG